MSFGSDPFDSIQGVLPIQEVMYIGSRVFSIEDRIPSIQPIMYYENKVSMFRTSYNNNGIYTIVLTFSLDSIKLPICCKAIIEAIVYHYLPKIEIKTNKWAHFVLTNDPKVLNKFKTKRYNKANNITLGRIVSRTQGIKTQDRIVKLLKWVNKNIPTNLKENEYLHRIKLQSLEYVLNATPLSITQESNSLKT